MTSYIPTGLAEAALIDAVLAKLRNHDDWMPNVMSAISTRIEELSNTIPHELELLIQREQDVSKQIENVVEFIARGNGPGNSSSITSRLNDLESELESTRNEIESKRSLSEGIITPPTQEFIDDQLRNLESVLKDDISKAAVLVREIVGRVIASHVIPIGKKRGYTQIRFCIDNWRTMQSVLESDPEHSHLLTSLNSDQIESTSNSEEIVVSLGKPTDVDLQSPVIYAMRNRGATWAEIEAATGISLNNACTYYKRYAQGLEQQKRMQEQNLRDRSNNSVNGANNQSPDSEGDSSAA